MTGVDYESDLMVGEFKVAISHEWVKQAALYLEACPRVGGIILVDKNLNKMAWFIRKYPQCDWCLQTVEHTDLKRVQVKKWATEPSKGIRMICKRCRRFLGREIRVRGIPDD